jgi:hypothetical protein
LHDGELPGVWRFILAFGIVFGLVIGGFLLIYSWILLLPLVLLALGVIWAFARANKKPTG